MLAARRAGLKRVILPKANAKELRKLPEAVRLEMEFILVEGFGEVVRSAIAGLDVTCRNAPVEV